MDKNLQYSGRGIAYFRKSTDERGFGPQNQAEWASQEARTLGVHLNVSLEVLDQMIAAGKCESDDMYLDHGVSGSLLSRPGFDAMFRRALTDNSITHIFVYQRDRFARPNYPTDAMQLECQLRVAGKTLVYRGQVLKPVKRGGVPIQEQIVSLVEFDASGKYLPDLAERVLRSQIALAKNGHWTGGNAPYGFKRVLVAPDGHARDLQRGERVRQAGHHTHIVPDDPDKIAILLKIVDLADRGWGIKRIAVELNRLGIPSPDAGRSRRDKKGHLHQVSGRWCPNTVADILRNKSIIAVRQWGERSEGRHRRLGADGPRELEDGDLSGTGNPRFSKNPDNVKIVAPAEYKPLVDPAKFERVQQRMKARGANQRGTTRSQDLYRYPLSGRVYDASDGCGWPMYGEMVDGVARQVCGRYKMTTGAECKHNTVGVAALSRLVLAALRTEILRKGLTPQLREKLLKIAMAESEQDNSKNHEAEVTAELQKLTQDLDKVTRSLAMEDNAKRRAAIQQVWDEKTELVVGKRRELEGLLNASALHPQALPVQEQVDEALLLLNNLAGLAEVAAGPEFMQLLATMNVHIWLWFKEVHKGKRVLNKVANGVLTTGNAPWPIQPYEGPRGVPLDNNTADTHNEPAGPSGPTGSSLQKVNRGERI